MRSLLVARATQTPIDGIDSTATAASSSYHSPAPAMLAAAISARSTVVNENMRKPFFMADLV